MTATRTTFLARFPEFSTQSTDIIDAALADAGRRIPTTLPQWETQGDDAIHLITAHLLTCRTLQLQQVSQNANIPTGSGDYKSTTYGQNYLEIVNSLGFCGFVV